MEPMVVGISQTYSKAEDAIMGLNSAGFSIDNISVIMTASKEEPKSNSLIDSITGLSSGIKGVNAFDIGELYVGGPIAGSLNLDSSDYDEDTGTDTGSLAGGLTNALMDIGFIEEDAHFYEDKIKNGEILIAIKIEKKDKEKAIDALKSHKLERVIYASVEDLA